MQSSFPSFVFGFFEVIAEVLSKNVLAFIFISIYLLSGKISSSFAFSSSMLRPRARMVPSGAKRMI